MNGPARVLLAVLAVSAAPGLNAGAAPLDIQDYGSKWSRRRPVRPHTRYILLHTTEGAERGSLEKLSREGEAHYLVGKRGTVYRIVDRSKIATHAGRSMWEARSNIDEHAIGIEVAGYHDKDPTRAQIRALKELLRQLQGIYGVPDARVLTHSMVAYGSPNRWHRRRHRGRKRCAMRLAEPRLRRALGLDDRPRFDPDVKAGRLVVADAELYRYLFPKQGVAGRARTPPKVPQEPNVIAAGRSPWDIAKEDYAAPTVVYRFPNGQVLRGDQVRDWKRIPAGTKVELNQPGTGTKRAQAPLVVAVARRDAKAPPSPAASEDADELDAALARLDQTPEAHVDARLDGFAVVGRDGASATAIAGDETKAPTTIYFFPDGLISTGADLAKSKKLRFLLESAPDGTRVLVGYAYGGYVKAHRTPSDICGARWNYPSTFYRFPNGKIVAGDRVDADRIPQNTLVFFQS